jgi:hypothetical protein
MELGVEEISKIKSASWQTKNQNNKPLSKSKKEFVF